MSGAEVVTAISLIAGVVIAWIDRRNRSLAVLRLTTQLPRRDLPQ